MNVADMINGSFELFGALAVLLSVRRTLRDKDVKGVSPLTVAFFTTWGLWNLYFYPALGQWWSAGAGAAVALANLTWVTLLVYFSTRQRRRAA